MPTIRCPSCGRALKLPDGEAAVASRCPLCDWEFVAKAAPRPAEPSSPSTPLPARPDDLHPADRNAMDAASQWLTAIVLLGPFHALFTYCFTLGAFAHALGLTDLGGDFVASMVVVAIVAQALAFCGIWSGAAAFSGTTNLGRARSAIRLAALLAVVYGGSSVVILLLPNEGLGGPPDAGRGVLFLAGAAMAFVCGMACLRTWQALARPLVARHLASRVAHEAE
jgi:hypothetical protein